MKHFIISEQTLVQINQIIMEMPTKFGVPLGNIIDGGLRPYEPPAPEAKPAPRPGPHRA